MSRVPLCSWGWKNRGGDEKTCCRPLRHQTRSLPVRGRLGHPHDQDYVGHEAERRESRPDGKRHPYECRRDAKVFRQPARDPKNPFLPALNESLFHVSSFLQDSLGANSSATCHSRIISAPTMAPARNIAPIQRRTWRPPRRSRPLRRSQMVLVGLLPPGNPGFPQPYAPESGKRRKTGTANQPGPAYAHRRPGNVCLLVVGMSSTSLPNVPTSYPHLG